MKPLVLRISNKMHVKHNRKEVDAKGGRNVIHDLEREIGQTSRPRVVLDCSELEEMRLAEVRLLMGCLEWVMKRNGDARLACVSPKSRECLLNSGIEGLFRIYDSSESAIRSFESHPNFEIVGEDSYGDIRGSDQIEERSGASSFRLTAVKKRGEVDEKRKSET